MHLYLSLSLDTFCIKNTLREAIAFMLLIHRFRILTSDDDNNDDNNDNSFEKNLMPKLRLAIRRYPLIRKRSKEDVSMVALEYRPGMKYFYRRG